MRKVFLKGSTQVDVKCLKPNLCGPFCGVAPSPPRPMYMYIYIYIYIYVCIYIYIYVTYIYIYTCNIYMCMYVCIHIYIYIYTKLGRQTAACGASRPKKERAGADLRRLCFYAAQGGGWRAGAKRSWGKTATASLSCIRILLNRLQGNCEKPYPLWNSTSRQWASSRMGPNMHWRAAHTYNV